MPIFSFGPVAGTAPPLLPGPGGSATAAYYAGQASLTGSSIGPGGIVTNTTAIPYIGPGIGSELSAILGYDPRLAKNVYLGDSPDVIQAVTSRPGLLQGLILIGVLLLARKL